ncbi:MAG: alpha/beta hydrolase [Solirubrobacteraceae bacterium]|nr:alpha/beta hydrolase [Solirubrobacteraceae bacterium]
MTSPPEQRHALSLPCGRTLSYATFGGDGRPVVVVLDGPGSRGLARASAAAADALGLQLVAPDRPGFGDSSKEDRAIADWPEDHAALLDAVGADRAGVVAQSGGTPYALAAAAALPDRVAALAFLGGLAPLDDPGAFAEAGKQLRMGVKLSRRAPWLLRLGLRAAGRSAARNPEKAARKFSGDLPAADLAVLEDPAMWKLHEQATVEILGQPDAVAREMGRIGRPWGVDIAAVRAPAAFWTGDHDVVHPPSHARRLAEALGGAPVEVVPDAATFGLLPIYPDALRFATQRSPVASDPAR